MVAPLSPSSICRRFRPSSSQSEPAGDGSRNAPPHPSALCCVRLLLTDQGGAHLTGVLGLPRNQDVDVGSRIGIGLSKYVDDQHMKKGSPSLRMYFMRAKSSKLLIRIFLSQFPGHNFFLDVEHHVYFGCFPIAPRLVNHVVDGC